MSIYAAQGLKATTAQTALTVISASTIRPRIVEFVLGSTGAPSSDASFQVQLKRFTAAGTAGTSPAGVGTDPNDPAAVVTFGSNLSIEPTYTANTTLAEVAVNPRGTFRWLAYMQSAELILPATTANGAGFLVNLLGGASTVTVDVKVQQ